MLSAIRKIIEERLTKKQKEILEFLSKEENQGKTLYRVVLELSRELNCSRSALYNNINSLKRCGLVGNEVGKPVKLTNIGCLILEEVEK